MSDKVLIERELLERLADIAEIEGQPEGAQARALLTAQPQASAAQSAPVIDLDANAWESIKQAASESKWIPPQYFMSDWVADVCEFLRGDRAAQSAPAGAVHDGLPLVIAGAIFDFAGFLTTREGVIEVGATANASPVADLIQEWAELRGLSLADAAVLSWQDLLAAWQRAQSAPVVPDVSAMARVLSDRSADACNIDRTDNWAMYGQEYIEDVQAMLAAAPAQPAAQDQGKVQELRELLVIAGSVLKNSGYPKIAARIDAALAASTGQEV